MVLKAAVTPSLPVHVSGVFTSQYTVYEHIRTTYTFVLQCDTFGLCHSAFLDGRHVCEVWRASTLSIIEPFVFPSRARNERISFREGYCVTV